MIENTLGVLHSITKNLENIRKHPRKGRETLTSGLMTSLLLKSLPVAMLLPVMRNGTICSTTIARKKRGKTLSSRTYFRSRNWSHFRCYDVTCSDACAMVRSPLILLKYDLNRPDILLLWIPFSGNLTILVPSRESNVNAMSSGGSLPRRHIFHLSKQIIYIYSCCLIVNMR